MSEMFPTRESKALSWIATTKLKITHPYRKHKGVAKRGKCTFSIIEACTTVVEEMKK